MWVLFILSEMTLKRKCGEKHMPKIRRKKEVINHGKRKRKCRD